jgi:hypothetical protein
MRVAWNASALAIALLWTLDGAYANEPVSHDRRLEQAALSRAAAKIGDLRGGQPHDADIAELIKQPRKTLREPPLAPPAEQSKRQLPPMVMNDTLAQEILYIDPVITGSNKKMAPVD